MSTLTITRQAAIQRVAAVLAEIGDPANASHYASRTKRVFANSREFASRKARMMCHQSNLCVSCGREMDETDTWEETDQAGKTVIVYGPDFPEVSHHLGAKRGNPRGQRGGYIWGNLSVWHKSCNRDNGEKDVNLDNLARPDLIVTSAQELPKV